MVTAVTANQTFTLSCLPTVWTFSYKVILKQTVDKKMNNVIENFPSLHSLCFKNDMNKYQKHNECHTMVQKS